MEEGRGVAVGVLSLGVCSRERAGWWGLGWVERARS